MKAIIMKVSALILVLALAAVFSACQGSLAKSETPDNTQGNMNNEGGNESPSEISKIEFEVITDESSLPDGVREKAENLKEQKGYTWVKNGKEYIFVIFSGEKSTGGYGIGVTDVSEIDGLVRITVEETSPGKDEMVIMALTYPRVIISFESEAEDFQVVGAGGEVFEKLVCEDCGEEGQITVTGEYVGQIDGTSIEVKVDGKEQAFRHEGVEELKETVESLKTGDIIKMVYYTNEHGQNMIVKIER